MKPVIGVFGGTGAAAEHSLAMARALGAALAGRDAVVLTGGYGPGDVGVKGAAIAGAGDGAWIGIGPVPPVEAWREGHAGLVLSTGLRHKRNYVEAVLCDGAICLPGEAGTLSEAVFSLSLGKPVAFWGEDWVADLSLPSPSGEVLEHLSKAAATKAAESPLAPGLDPLLSAASVRRGLQKLLPCRLFPASAAPEIVLAWLLEAVAARSVQAPARRLPPFEGSAQLQTALDAWALDHAG